MTSSLYIHIPFCAAKCNYCSFNSYAGLEGLQERYVKALCGEMLKCAQRAGQGSIKSVFLGGGTPTLLSAKLLKQILSICSSSFTISSSAEISIEANPGTVDRRKLTALLESGVNRLSIGVQSFNDLELKAIGRIHTASEAIKAVELASAIGFDNLSLDLMYGLPGQSAERWLTSLETGLSLGVKHLSLYQLTVEEQTPLESMIEREILQLPSDKEIEAMDEITGKCTATAGYPQYEISNYAKAGYQSRHNITYWENREYFGFGAGAVSCISGTRRQNITSPEQYCCLLEAEKSVVIEEERLEPDASFRETVVMGLRMNRGISLAMLEKRYGISLENYYGKILQKLISDGMLEKNTGFLFLTDTGRGFANRVMAELV
jgi:oxygen-independent coproporphyrinogen III oxidase